MTTPNHIEVLIHCHVSPEPHPRLNAPAVQAALRDMADNGLIRHVHDGVYETTDLGCAHVRQLCRLDLPQRQWLDWDGEPL